MTYDNKLLIQAFIFDALSLVGDIELKKDVLIFKNDKHRIEVNFSEAKGLDSGDLFYLIQSLAT